MIIIPPPPPPITLCLTGRHLYVIYLQLCFHKTSKLSVYSSENIDVGMMYGIMSELIMVHSCQTFWTNPKRLTEVKFNLLIMSSQVNMIRKYYNPGSYQVYASAKVKLLKARFTGTWYSTRLLWLIRKKKHILVHVLYHFRIWTLVFNKHKHDVSHLSWTFIILYFLNKIVVTTFAHK